MKIISDGTKIGTRLVDDTGNPIGLIQKLTWECNAADVLTKITLELVNIPVEITTKADINLIEYLDQGAGYEPVHTKTFEKEIKITSENQSNNTFAQLVKIVDAATNEQVGAIQEVKWEATPEGSKATVKRVKFDNKDW